MTIYKMRISFVRKGYIPRLERVGSDGSSDEILVDCRGNWAAHKMATLVDGIPLCSNVFLLQPRKKRKYIMLSMTYGLDVKKFKFAITKYSLDGKPIFYK